MPSDSNLSSSNQLPNSIPKLQTGGENWVIFNARFTDAMDAKGYLSHFMGDVPEPKKPDDESDTTAMATYSTALEKWQRNKANACYFLSQRLPNTLLISTKGLTSVANQWAYLTRSMTNKSIHLQADQCQKFLSSRARPGENVRTFLDNLKMSRKTLAANSVNIETSEYLATIVHSLPDSLGSYASTFIDNIRLLKPDQDIDPEAIITLVGNEWQRRADKRGQMQSLLKVQVAVAQSTMVPAAYEA